MWWESTVPDWLYQTPVFVVPDLSIPQIGITPTTGVSGTVSFTMPTDGSAPDGLTVQILPPAGYSTPSALNTGALPSNQNVVTLTFVVVNTLLPGTPVPTPTVNVRVIDQVGNPVVGATVTSFPTQ